jgi:ribosomal protein L28
MPAICPITGKKSKVQNNRSKSMRSTKTRKFANLQRINFGGVIVKVSARGLRTLDKGFRMSIKKQKAEKAAKLA